MTELHKEGEVANGDPKRDKIRTKQTIIMKKNRNKKKHTRKTKEKRQEKGKKRVI